MSVNENTASFPITCVGNPELLFHLAGAEDVEELSEFVINQLFHQFPMKNTPGFDVEKEIRPWMTEYISHMWPKNYSIIIRDTNNHNKIVAAAVSDIGCKNHSGDIGLYSFCDPVERPGWERICRLLDGLRVGIDLGQNPMLIIDLVAVDTAYYNRGLSTECLNLAVKLAQSRGVQKMKIEAVNEYMAKAAVKAGFELISETDYTQWEFNGEKPFASIHGIHKMARLFVYKTKNSIN